MTSYLRKQTLFPALIADAPAPALGMVVVVPARDEPRLVDSLSALAACSLPPEAVEVIVIVNGAADDPPDVRDRNRRACEEALAWAETRQQPQRRFHILSFPDLSPKQAGVGLARKIGMDEACRRLEGAGRPRGVIAGFDADSRCDPNYLQALSAHFRRHPETQACSIYFEHPLVGNEFPTAVYHAIAAYELHLRYFIEAQRYAGFPFAHHTIGSSMAVRCDAYQEQGGMNRRKAGEDFYFLHKFTPLGRYSELTSTRVLPSPRPSHRVPFGTGKAVQEQLAEGGHRRTYAPNTFIELQQFFGRADKQGAALAHDWPKCQGSLPPAIAAFLDGINAGRRLKNIARHTASPAAFRRRFYRWFDAFQIMKFAHFARDHYYPEVPVAEAAAWLLEAKGYPLKGVRTEKRLLEKYRSLARSFPS